MKPELLPRRRRRSGLPAKPDYQRTALEIAMLADEVIREHRRLYTYRVHVRGELVYVGVGSGGRWLGSANKHNGIAGIVEYYRTASEALEAEKDLIAELKPPRNIAPGGRTKVGHQPRKLFHQEHS